ncbi:MAG: DUF4920 domain-containing protein [Phycisphaerae bacterium]|jgi:hypothetical protein
MHKSLRVVVFCFSGSLLLTGCASTKWARYGEPLKLPEDDAVCCGRLLSAPSNFDGKHIRLKGMVKAVCETRGCWMRVGCQEVSDTVFVKFRCPIGGRLIPMEAKSHRAVVEGRFALKEISEADARHMKKDAGGTPDEIAQIVGPQKMAMLDARGAEVDLEGPPGCCD